MDNYEAIRRMSCKQMEVFLDNVLLTGLNLAIYAKTLDGDSEEQLSALGSNPYNSDWLLEEAEDATRFVFADDGDIYLPKAFCDAVFKAAGIKPNDKKEGYL